MFRKNIKNKGFTLIEVLVACVIISLTILSLMSAASKGIELSNKALRMVQTSMILEEGAEAVKSIRDNNWTTISNLTFNTNYYLSFSSNKWLLSTTPSTIDGIFTRTILFNSVSRDVNDDISNSGVVDTGIKKVTVTTSWVEKGSTNSKSLSFYLANIFN